MRDNPLLEQSASVRATARASKKNGTSTVNGLAGSKGLFTTMQTFPRRILPDYSGNARRLRSFSMRRIKQIVKKALQEDRDAQFELAMWFYEKGVFERAQFWFKKAARSGNLAALKFCLSKFKIPKTRLLDK
jgi:TPR repeat protein